jgi:DNA/RNA endonuclease G (NUC1)
MQCHFKKEDVDECVAEVESDPDSAPGDPFHPDTALDQGGFAFLGTGAFSSTQHDRGHLAPNNAFSWHICGAYKTFTMANMAAQHANFNRQIWARLEAGVLFWAVELGPIYVVTGPIYSEFPKDEFEIFANGDVDEIKLVPVGDALKTTNGTTVSPEITRATGFFKVIYQPATDSEPERAIAFLLPHTSESRSDYMSFVSTVALVEEASGFTFGFSDALKHGSGQLFWIQDHRPPGGFSVRDDDCDAFSAVA